MISISPELVCIRMCLKDRTFLDKYQDTLDSIDLDKQLKALQRLIRDYYDEFPEHIYCSKDEIITYCDVKYAVAKDLNAYKDLLSKAYELDISDSIGSSIMRSIIERNTANKIINKLLPCITENKTGALSTIEEDIDYFNSFSTKEEQTSPFVEDDISEILEELVGSEAGFKWRLQCLQDDMGSLIGGVLGHIYARPNTGKSSFISSEVTNFARQLAEGECILWANNEERGRKVKARLYNASLGISSDAIYRNLESAKSEFIRRNGSSIHLYDSGIITMQDIKDLIKQYKPRLVVIDQGDKIHFKGSGGMDIPVRLKELYKHYRELAKEEDIPIITVGQASSEAEGKKWLRPDWMDYSRTGKYAEMDWIIGIGKTHDEGEQHLRYLAINKNKMKGIERNHTVKFDHMTGRYTDLC